MNVWRRIYEPLAFVISILLFPFFLMHPRGRLRIAERYGSWGGISDRVIWFHGASVGEINGLLPLIGQTRKKFPGRGILVTAVSPTGLVRVEDSADYTRLLPFDSSPWIRRAIRGLTIDALVFGETEIWPTLLHELHKRNVPIVMVNARISDYTYSIYRFLMPLLAPELKQLTAVCASTKGDAERLRAIGAPDTRVHFTGNAKYDTHPSISSKEKGEALRCTMFSTADPVVVLGSLRPGEESFWFSAFERVWREGRRIHCVVAPRHQEKFEFFARALESRGIPFVRRTEGRPAEESRNERVLLLDTMGELESTYSFAEGAFVGGTLCDVGGHTPFEAAAYSVSLASGPHTKNIREVVSYLEKAEALTLVHTEEDVYKFLLGIAQRDPELRRRGQNGYKLWQQMQGASDKICAAVFAVVEGKA